MIHSVTFRNFKALRQASVTLAPFNLIVGANGSGKTSLIQALQRLQALAKLPLRPAEVVGEFRADGPEIAVKFTPPHDGLEAVMACVHENMCDFLQIVPQLAGEGADDWTGLRARILSLRAYTFDYFAMALPTPRTNGEQLAGNGANLAAVLAGWGERHPEALETYCMELWRLLPEYDRLLLPTHVGGTVEMALRLTDGGEVVTAENLSQGTLCAMALYALAFDPDPPALVCIEEVDRGLHPRLLREVRDVLYRLSYPQDWGSARPAVQVIATSHSPYLLDLFKEHPEEVVIAQKHGREASFSRLSDREDLDGLLAEGTLGDMWFAGILGGVPEDK